MAPLRHAFVSLLLLVATTLLLAQPFGSSNNGVRADARLLNRATSTAASALHARNGFLVLPLASPRAVGGRDDEESGVDTFASGARAGRLVSCG